MTNEDYEYIEYAINEGFTESFADFYLEHYKELEEEKSKGRFVEYLRNIQASK
jgi:hypothetical protein